MNDEWLATDQEEEVVFAGEVGDQEMEYDNEFEQDQELEAAAELLSISNEEELDQFLGKLMKRAAGAARGIISSPAGTQLKALLRRTAKKALPMAGRAIGGYFGGQRGGDFGATVGGAAGQLFGLELEGMSGEDQELEVARRVVRLANDATRQIATNSNQSAAAALTAAAARHAPGLLRTRRNGGGGGTPSNGSNGGRWIRNKRGNIVLFGI